jgi:2-phospho-L-lactate guanylyltransferase
VATPERPGLADPPALPPRCQHYHLQVTDLADFSRIHVVLPVRSISGGKARLGGALDAEERETLILGMLRHIVLTIREWGGAAATHVVSLDPSVLADAAALGSDTVRQLHGGLNEAIVAGRQRAVEAGATAMLVLPADLPLLNRASLERLVDAADAALAAGSGRPVVVLAPADARGGTNALLVSPADLIEPDFGHMSLQCHAQAAADVEATLLLVVDAGLGFDLDTPDDVDRIGVVGLDHLLELGSRSAGSVGRGSVAADAPAS